MCAHFFTCWTRQASHNIWTLKPLAQCICATHSLSSSHWFYYNLVVGCRLLHSSMNVWRITIVYCTTRIGLFVYQHQTLSMLYFLSLSRLFIHASYHQTHLTALKIMCSLFIYYTTTFLFVCVKCLKIFLRITQHFYFAFESYWCFTL